MFISYWPRGLCFALVPQITQGPRKHFDHIDILKKQAKHNFGLPEWVLQVDLGTLGTRLGCRVQISKIRYNSEFTKSIKWSRDLPDISVFLQLSQRSMTRSSRAPDGSRGTPGGPSHPFNWENFMKYWKYVDVEYIYTNKYGQCQAVVMWTGSRMFGSARGKCTWNS